MMQGITGESERSITAAEMNGAVMALCRLLQVGGSRRSSEEAFGLAADLVAALLNVDRVAVLALDQENDHLRVAGLHGFPRSISRNGHVLGEDIARRCLRNLAPIVIPDTSVSGYPAAKEFFRLGVRSVVCVPLHAGDQAFGAILAMTDTLRRFTPSQIELLHTIASQSALAVWQARNAGPETPKISGAVAGYHSQAELMQLANRKTQELSIVNRVSQAVISTLDLNKLLNIILDESMAAVGAGAGSLMLIGEDGLLRIVVSRGLPEELADKVRVRLGEGIAGRVAQQGAPALLTKGKEREFAEVSLRPDITSSMSVPLYTSTQVIGVLNVSTVAPNKEFTRHDLELLSTMANQMAMAVYNARLHQDIQRQASELSALLEIAHTVTATLELDEVLQRVTREIGRLVEVDVCSVLLYDEISDRLKFGAGHGLVKTRKHHSLKWQYVDIARSAAFRAIRTGEVVLCRDVQAHDSPHPSVIAKEAGLRSMLCIPLKTKKRVVGAAAVFSHRQRPFTRDEVDLLTALGELSGIAIENARSYQHKFRIADLTVNDLTPRIAVHTDGLDIGQRFFAVREVGGDYYDFFPVAPGKLGIVLADVAGSSVAAAAYTSMTRNVLRAYAREYASPAQVMAKVNDLVREDTDPELFVSLFYGVLDLKTKEMTYCLAGHEPPLLYRPSTGRFRMLRADGMLVGILPNVEFEERKVKLREGDLVAIFTDGLTETKAKSRRFGLAPLKQVIQADAFKPAQEVADNIYGRLAGFASNRVQDDVALLVLKVR